MKNRRGEDAKTYFRTVRFVCINGEWFFTTRENIDIGPFSSKEEAEAESHLFIRHMSEGGAMADAKKAMYQEWAKPGDDDPDNVSSWNLKR